jgi:cytoskeletal protein CcmA (bactofilin family)
MNHSSDENVRRVSLLGPNSELNGDFVADEELVILGRVLGKRVQAPTITIGPNARVEADIYTQSICIEGIVIGDIHAKVSVMVQATATLRGTIRCPSITIRDGASVNGAANVEIAKDGGAREAGRPARRAAARRRA